MAGPPAAPAPLRVLLRRQVDRLSAALDEMAMRVDREVGDADDGIAMLSSVFRSSQPSPAMIVGSSGGLVE